MGNCLFGGMGDGGGGDGDESTIKVTTANGGVMEFSAPVTAEAITDEFPGHGLFRSRDLFWKPLSHSEALEAGESYHLLPLKPKGAGHVRSSSAPPPRQQPYRMSVDSGRKEEAAAGGFWKVKLVINTEQLLEILAEEGKTGELLESVRTVAKCGSGLGGFSDHWSLSSSRSRSRSKDTATLLDF